MSERLGLLETLGLAHVLLTMTRLYFDRRLEDVLNDVLSACELLCRLGLARQSPAFLLNEAAYALCELARWDQAVDCAQQSCVMTEFDMAPVAEIHLARVDMARGDLDQARARLEQPPNLMTVGPLITRMHFELLAELQIWQGRPDDALSTVKAGLDHLAELGQVMFSGRLLVHGMRACADSADRARAARTDATLMRALDVAAELRAWVSSRQLDPLDPQVTPVATTAADAATWAAEESRLHGRSDPERWLAAAALWQAADRPLPVAYALWRQVEALISDPDSRNSGGTVLHQARQAADLAGAKLIQRELDALGRRARLPLHAPTIFPDDQPPSIQPLSGKLTARELEILRHLANGCTNREIAKLLFLSPKTVGVHVSHILQKLDVHDRVEAATRAHRLGLVD